MTPKPLSLDPEPIGVPSATGHVGHLSHSKPLRPPFTPSTRSSVLLYRQKDVPPPAQAMKKSASDPSQLPHCKGPNLPV
jgi:hypothetical protein